MVLFENGADVIDQRPIAANTAQLIRPTFRQTLLKEKKEQNYSSSKIGRKKIMNNCLCLVTTKVLKVKDYRQRKWGQGNQMDRQDTLSAICGNNLTGGE